MDNPIRYTLLLFFLLLMISKSSHACDCTVNTIGWDYCNSDVVMVGKVKSTKTSWIKIGDRIGFGENPDSILCNVDFHGDTNRSGKYHYCIPIEIYEIQCDQTFKGIESKKIIHIYSITNTNCSHHLSIDTEYVFFLHKNPRSDIYGTKTIASFNSCSRIKELSNSESDLCFIHEAKKLSSEDKIYALEETLLIENWRELASELSLKIAIDKQIKLGSTQVNFPVYLENFGPKNGAIICNKQLYSEELLFKLHENQYAIINANSLESGDDLNEIKKKLSALGYFGSNRLDWYNDTLREFERHY